MPKVTFQGTGQSVDVEAGTLLREIIQKNGWPIPFGCENGICGTCLIHVAEGTENLSPVEGHEAQTLKAMGKGDDYRLACQCTVNGDVTIAQ